MASPILRIIRANEPDERVAIEGNMIRIGRSSQNEVTLSDPRLSRQHFELRRDTSGWVLNDMGSRNGTFLNGERLDQPRRLAFGDRISVGRMVLIFEPGSVADTDSQAFSDTLIFEASSLARAIMAEDIAEEIGRQSLVSLNRVGEQLLSSNDRRELLDGLAERLVEVFTADFAAIVGFESGSSGLLANAVRPGYPGSTLLDAEIHDEVLRERSAVLASDAPGSGPQRSVIAVPLAVGDAILGLLWVQAHGRAKAFQRAEASLLSAIGNLVASKLEGLRFFAEAMDKARLDRELGLAAEVQARMLPSPPLGYGCWDVEAIAKPSREIGGDYYDVMPAGERLTLTVGDVSGKGISSALLMASAKSMLTALTDFIESPAERLSILNRHLRRSSQAKRFLTLVHVDAFSDGKLRWASAGHPPGYVIHPDGRLESLAPTGALLGVLDTTWREGASFCPPGGLIALFSDGLTEAESTEGELFGDHKLEEIAQSLAGLGADEALERLLAGLYEFAPGRIEDDLTVLFARRALDDGSST